MILRWPKRRRNPKVLVIRADGLAQTVWLRRPPRPLTLGRPQGILEAGMPKASVGSLQPGQPQFRCGLVKTLKL